MRYAVLTKIKTCSILWLILPVSALVPLAALWGSLTPSVTFGDSGEFLTQIATLGIAHPPGFPLYLLLGKLFSLLPFGEFAWRISLMSAVFASLTSLLLSDAVWLLTKRWWLALLAPWIFIMFPLYWQQATMAEVYTLNTLCIAAVLVILLQWRKNKAIVWLLLAAFLFGLGATNRAMILLYGPGVVLFLLASGMTIRHWRQWGLAAVFFALGLSLYAYLPIRSQSNPPAAWAETKTLQQVMRHITRQDYSPMGVSNQGISTPFGWKDAGLYLEDFTNEATDMLGFALWPFALLGIVVLFKRDRAVAELCCAAIVITVTGTIISGLYIYSNGTAEAYRILFLQALLPLVFLTAAGIDALVRRAENWKTPIQAKRVLAIGCAGVLVLTSGTALAHNLLQENRSKETMVINTAEKILQSMDPNGILAIRDMGTLGDSIDFSMLYLQKVRHVRPDVTVVTPGAYFHDDRFLSQYIGISPLIEGKALDRMFLASMLDAPAAQGRPIYSLEPFAHTGLVFPRSDGLLYRLFRTKEEAARYKPPEHPVPFYTLVSSFPRREQTTEERTLLAVYYYNRAYYFAQHGALKKSGRSLGLAIGYDPDPMSVWYYKFIIARNQLGITQQAQP